MIKHLRPTPFILLTWLWFPVILFVLVGTPIVFLGIDFLLIYALASYVFVAALSWLIGSSLYQRRRALVAGTCVAFLALGPLPPSWQ